MVSCNRDAIKISEDKRNIPVDYYHLMFFKEMIVCFSLNTFSSKTALNHNKLHYTQPLCTVITSFYCLFMTTIEPPPGT